MAEYDIVDSKDNLCIYDAKPVDQNLSITSSENEGRNTAYGGSITSDLSTITVKLEIGNADENGCNVAIDNTSGPSPTILSHSGKSDHEYKLSSCDTSDSITIGQHKSISPVRKTVDSENWIKKEPCSPTDPCQTLRKDTIVIDSNVDDVVSGNADLENDIAGKSLYSNNTPSMESDWKRVKSEPAEMPLNEHRRNSSNVERKQFSDEFSVTSRPRLKGDFKCRICVKAYVLCSAIKNHMIQKHPHCRDLCALEEIANKDSGNSDSQLVWFCPRNCKYLTSEYNALLEHLVTCLEPNLLSRRNRAGKAQIENNLCPFQYDKEPCRDVSAEDLLVHVQQTGQTSSIPGHTLKHEMQTEDQHCDDIPTCQLCSSVFSTNLQLEGHLKDCQEERHIRTHAGKKTFECSYCGKNFCNSDKLCVHIRIHTGEKPFKCSHCDKRFSQSCNLKEHIKTHTGEKPFKCSHCNRIFSYKSNLDRHRRTHSGKKPFECSHCDKRFSQSCHLNEHIKTHTGEKPFECTHCNKIFGYKSNLDRHRRTHTGKKPFECTHCNKIFFYRNHLRVHLKTHTGEKSFKCSHCDSGFFNRNHLRVHLRTHTGEKPFKCSHCDKRFTQSGSLNVHIRTHTGEKPFECTHCNKSFSYKSHLRVHLRTHTGEKPFKCSHCDNRFSQSCHLNMHIRTYTGNKPFKCTHCNKTFCYPGQLRVHLRTHTGDNTFQM